MCSLLPNAEIRLLLIHSLFLSAHSQCSRCHSPSLPIVPESPKLGLYESRLMSMKKNRWNTCFNLSLHAAAAWNQLAWFSSILQPWRTSASLVFTASISPLGIAGMHTMRLPLCNPSFTGSNVYIKEVLISKYWLKLDRTLWKMLFDFLRLRADGRHIYAVDFPIYKVRKSWHRLGSCASSHPDAQVGKGPIRDYRRGFRNLCPVLGEGGSILLNKERLKFMVLK